MEVLVRRIARAAALLVLLAPGVAHAQGESDPKAVALADQVLEALGGKAAWSATRFLRFDFAVEVDGKTVMSRAHTWDKWNGRYRVEGRTKDGKALLVLMNIDTGEGRAWLDGVEAAGEEKKKLLERGHAIWVNDTYWLLMPYKLRDPGVHLAYAGEEKPAGQVWDKLLMTFHDVGLTPKDRYWVWVNRSTHLVDRWDYILQGGPGPATRFDWKDWARFGRIQLARERWNAAEKERIHFPVLDAPDSVPDGAFTEKDARP